MKVTLLGTSPPVWRRVLVDRDMTLRDLHLTLQAVMGWENSHLHQCVLPGRWNRNPQRGFCTKIVNESRTRVGDVIGTAGERPVYEYDLGDGWQHELRLEEVLLGDESFQPMCVAGERCCPPEDCGGPQGFAPRCSPHYGTPVTPATRKSVSGSAISILSLSLLTNLPDGYAGVGSFKTGTWTYVAPEYGRTRSPELSRSAAPAFKHTINVVANCVSGILAAQSPH